GDGPTWFSNPIMWRPQRRPRTEARIRRPDDLSEALTSQGPLQKWRAPSNELGRQDAAHEVALAGRQQGRRLRRAVGTYERAARGEAAAGRDLGEVGWRAGDGFQPLATHAVVHGRGEQAAAVGMLRSIDHLLHRCQFDDLAGIHDADAVG